MAAQLRVYSEPSGEYDDFGIQAPTIGIRLSELLPLVALAEHENYAWLQDFLDDEVRITPDLYDVLRAFRNYRPSA
jgi:hypothetical protein